jgi:hypothetical protein
MDSTPNGTEPWLDPSPNRLNPERTQPRMDSTPNGLNTEWTEPRKDWTENGQNWEWTELRMERTQDGTQHRIDLGLDFKKNEHNINLERSPSSLKWKAWRIELGGSSSTHYYWSRNYAIWGWEEFEVESPSGLSPSRDWDHSGLSSFRGWVHSGLSTSRDWVHSV